MDLADWLLARIADDEAAARAAVEDMVRYDMRDEDGDEPTPWTSWSRPGWNLSQWKIAAHIARHDPARVLADCEAKRGIVEADWRADDSGDASIIRQDVLRLLALPYADHESYREEWRP